MGRSTQVCLVLPLLMVRGKMRATFKDEFAGSRYLIDHSMRISKESLFNIMNLQTIASEGHMVNMFSPRGESDHIIEVIGMLLPPVF